MLWQTQVWTSKEPAGGIRVVSNDAFVHMRRMRVTTDHGGSVFLADVFPSQIGPESESGESVTTDASPEYGSEVSELRSTSTTLSLLDYSPAPLLIPITPAIQLPSPLLGSDVNQCHHQHVSTAE